MCSDCAHTSGAAEPWKYTCGVRFSYPPPECRSITKSALPVTSRSIYAASLCVSLPFASPGNSRFRLRPSPGNTSLLRLISPS